MDKVIKKLDGTVMVLIDSDYIKLDDVVLQRQSYLYMVQAKHNLINELRVSLSHLENSESELMWKLNDVEYKLRFAKEETAKLDAQLKTMRGRNVYYAKEEKPAREVHLEGIIKKLLRIISDKANSPKSMSDALKVSESLV